MVEIDREQFAKLVTSAWKLAGKNIDNDSLELFWESLRDHSLQVVTNALAVHVKNSAYAPKPSDVLKIINPKGSYANTSNNPQRHQCDWITQGQRCHSLGVLSPSTNGGGPWYCPDHFYNRAPNQNQHRIGDLVEDLKTEEHAA